MFLQTVLGHDGLQGTLSAHIWHRLDNYTDWVRDPTAADRAVRSNGRKDVYLSVGLAAKPGGDRERLKVADAVGVLGVLGDIDIFGPMHKGQNLPPDEAAALAMVAELGLDPTIIVQSGHGIQGWWLFERPWIFADEADKARALRLCAAWQRHINTVAARHGWKFDGVGDLSRVFRMPGTVNVKDPNDPVDVRLLRLTPTTRHRVADIERMCAEELTGDAVVDFARLGGASVTSQQRFTRENPCPICYGHAGLPPGIGERCWGFISDDEVYANCTREDYAGNLIDKMNPNSNTFPHRLVGECGCGETHDHDDDNGPHQDQDHDSHNGTGAPPTGHKWQRVNLPTYLELDLLTRKSLAALARANNPLRYAPGLYVRGGRLVRVHYDEHGQPSIFTLTVAPLAEEIARVVQFQQRLKGGGSKNVFPPERVVQAVLEAPRFTVPALVGLTESPVLRPDGTVLTTPGYDLATGLLYLPTPGGAVVPAVSDVPTDAEVASAFALLHEVIVDFPFALKADRANALALLITLVMRPAIDGNIPLALLDATKAGTGKGLLAQVCSIIATGRQSPTMTEWRTEDETRKQITTHLMTGRPLHIIDNVTHRIDSPQLASLFTAAEWTDRLLSTNQTVHIPASGRGVWCATGNNITLGGDLPRRCYRVRIDAKTALPAQRAGWKHDPLDKWVQAERGRILHAVLTVCRAWFARGCPAAQVPTMGGFEPWARMVGGVLALDLTGVGRQFLDNAEDVWEEGDSEAEEWLPFLMQVEADMSDEQFTTRQVADRCVNSYDVGPGYTDTALAKTLPRDLAAHVRDATFVTRLGVAFRQHMDTRYGDAGYRLERVGRTQGHTAVWRVAQD